MKTIIDLFNVACNKNRNKTACIYRDKKITFAKLKEQVDKTAKTLQGLGIKPGDCVALLLSKRPELIVSYLAIAKIGAINVPINYKLTAKELKPIFAKTNPKLLLFEHEQKNKIEEMKECIKLPQALIVNEKDENYSSINDLSEIYSECKLEYTPESSDIVAIQYTSGTTNFPKGAAWSHAGIIAHVKAMAETYQLKKQDNWLILLPSFLSTHNSVILPLITGSTSVLMENNNPHKILAAIEKNKISTIMCAAVVCLAMLKLTKPEKYDISSLRLVIPGGMRFPLRDLIDFEKKFNTSVMDVLAMTEMGIYISNNHSNKKYGSLGKPISGVEAKIVDDEGIEVPSGTIGNIIAKGPSMFCRYFRLSAETKKVIKNGWFFTGDLGWQDKDGFFYHVSRKSEMINVGGYKIFPQEIEEVLLGNEKINEVAISSVQDVIRGEIPKVLVVLKEGVVCSKNEIIKYCNNKLARYKIPKMIKFCNALPKTGSGKIYRKALCEW